MAAEQATTSHIALLAGEVSGDNLGGALIDALRERRPETGFWGVGGENMLNRGLDSLFPIDDIAVMGIIEPLKILPKLIRRKNLMVQTLLQHPPKAFIGIDSPDFNLRIARDLKANNPDVPIIHYVSPSVWAWRQGRVIGIKMSVDLMLTLFPFESAFYDKHYVPNRCIGHPMAEQLPLEHDIGVARAALSLETGRTIIALLPGSRHSEIERHLPTYLAAAELLRAQNSTIQFILPIAKPSLRKSIELHLQKHPQLDITLLDGQSTAALQAADLAIVTSGTATLEVMLCRCPMIVGYRTSGTTYAIAKRLVKSEHVAIPNLLANTRLVPELIQQDCTAAALAQQAQRILDNPEQQQALKARFVELHQGLRLGGSDAAAEAILELIARKAANHSTSLTQ